MQIYLSRLRRILGTVTLMLAAVALGFATHNRAGEITYEQIGELTIRVTITTYTKTSSITADRDTLDIYWGDGTTSRIGRVNGNGDPLPNDVKRNFYVGEHTFPGRATYHMYFTDPNRIDGIKNISNSIMIKFHVQTTFTFLSGQFQGSNSSAILLQPPIDFACVGKRFIHNPNAYDPDGDSLAYELIMPLEDVQEEVPGYVFPDRIRSGPGNRLTLNEETGDLVWDAPQEPGEYNVAIKILEYRGGILLNSIIRDMQIFVESCTDSPPEIEIPEEICVVAGDKITLDVRATDPDVPTQRLSLSALGGPFEVDVSPATFSIDGRYRDQPVLGTFSWQTTCEHIAEHPYTVVFKATDDLFDTTGLASLKTLLIKVVGPAPTNLTTETENRQNKISWDNPYSCDMTEDDYFVGFTVWRRKSSNGFIVDTCDPGLEGKGYTPIAYSIKDIEEDRYIYTDSDVNPGDICCYRVTATFAQTSIAGYRYNYVESLASNEDCAGFLLDKPYILKASVSQTSTTAGEVEIEWSSLSPTDFDTTVFTGPYRFVLKRGTGFTPTALIPVPGADFTSSLFSGLVDTTFVDQNLNTQDQPYTYQVDFYNAGVLYSSSNTASTPYLTIAQSDKSLILDWEAMVPWQNYRYRVLKRAPAQTDFRLVATTTEPTYQDTGLINGEEYCYFIETEGSYGFAKLPEPLINLSQITCEVPADRVPPCTPTASVRNSCDDASLSRDGLFFNRINWTFDFTNCSNPDDVAGYRIYYKPDADTTYSFLIQLDDPTITHYDHGTETGLAGCYGVTALDTLGNESDTSTIFCVENCPFYELPNTFTPNGDGANDLFTAYPYKFIDKVDMKIFNRWGQLVFETADPDINWDGKNLSGKDLAVGVYHYICTVFESQGGATESGTALTGFIELIR